MKPLLRYKPLKRGQQNHSPHKEGKGKEKECCDVFIELLSLCNVVNNYQ